MNKSRLSLIVALAAALAVLAGGWFLGAQPQIAQASTNASQRADIAATNSGNRAELRRLEKASESLDSTKRELAALRASVPAAPETDSLLSQLNLAASSSAVTVTSVTFGEPKAYLPEGSGSAAAPSPSASPSAASSSATPTAAATPAAPTPYSDDQITASNFVLIPVTVAVTGSYDQALSFTKAVQGGERLFLVNGIAATSADEGDSPMASQAWSLSGSVYVLSDAAAAASAKG
ncbi:MULTISPECIES: hypothetical protein [unclassified Curtobacterium]|uniref:hypothetical protein n=1 Tax=unclassified Curtobacterium TaxID=257496 RepID=UPI00104FD5B6|nr:MULTISPECIES: hypothetical protein [unclassified Curtobacterium]MBF4584699.1 hypothetical protein [Curtobacterium sp. VKM Ac-2887]TCL79960.1 hypothetical protein EDF23_102353 [Curtobacterium sp. PhB128]TCL97866.1 hypothetical protein EDF29_10297 [Curtobacterium sp. PhB138]